MQLKLCVTTDDERVANKKINVLYTLETGEFHFKNYPNSVENPSIILNGVYEGNINYCMFRDRKFFIRSRERLEHGMIKYNLEEDYLTTFWDEIKKRSCVIARQEKTKSPYFIDNKLPCLVTKQIQTIPFNVFVTDYVYYLTVTGGVNQ